MEGKPIVGARLHESIRLYALCKGMKWAHLPVSGGLYDQHPQIIDDFYTIMGLEAKAERRRAEEQRRQSKSKKGRR